MQCLAWARVRTRQSCQEVISMSDKQTPSLNRRRVFAAGGTVGALAAAAAVMPLSKPASPPEPAAKPAPESGGGYQLTAHVQQYYNTARV
jgi:hypothetical protein